MNQDFIVSILEDENDGDFSAGDLSLREAIALANEQEGEDTITFDTSLDGDTIVLSQGELKIEDSLTVNGLGAENTIIDANGINRVFNIDDGNEDTQADVVLDGLAITGSSRGEFNPIDRSTLLDSGGGILNSENLEVNNTHIYDNEVFYSGAGISSSGTLTVNNSAIYSNLVSSNGSRGGADVAGGGIDSSGTLTVNNSAIYSNSASGGGGFANGGGIDNRGTATINQSTISDNGVGARGNTGGGIGNSEGDLTITNSTISNNSSNSAGGISNNGGEVTVTSTIIANVGNQNISGDDFVSGGNNFISGEAEVGSRGGLIIIGAEGFTNGENGDIVGTLENPIDPQLGELQDNGGSTPTIALLENSPAIDAGANPNDLATDQRGEGFDRTVGETTDIGAFEVQDATAGREIRGTEGDDELSGTEANDIIFGLGGNDSIDGGIDGRDLLRGEDGDDTLDGGPLADSLLGAEGDDLLLGGKGNDTIDGGSGNDSIEAGVNDDLVFASEGDDTILGGSGKDTLIGGIGNGNDSIDGGVGNDELIGGDGNDTLTGGNGGDTLDGGIGDDLITGGDNDDIFVLTTEGGIDTITDFGTGNDVLGISEEISFSDLSFNGNEIIFGDSTLATLNSFDTTTLTESDFASGDFLTI